MAEDKTLKCKDCGNNFTFSVGEQEFYALKGFDNEPVRCAACRKIKKNQRSAMNGVRFRDRDEFSFESSFGSGFRSDR